jgi:hypothetical protein
MGGHAILKHYWSMPVRTAALTIAAMIASLVCACVPPTFPPDLPTAARPAHKTFDMDKDTAFRAAAVALLDWGTQEYAQDLGIIKGSGRATKVSFDRWAVPPMEDRFIYARHFGYNIVVAESEPGRTTVTVKCNFVATLRIGYQVVNRNAKTKGVLENELLALIEKALPERPTAP